MSNVRKAILLDETAQAIRAGIKEAASSIAAAIDGKSFDNYVLYGFHIDGSEADPGKAVTYLEDAVGMTPARMDYLNNTFAYGSWIDAFFMPRPCMVKYDGTVDYYLNPYNYDQKENGELSDIGDPNTNYGVTYNGNAMMEWGSNGQQIWTKVVPDPNDPLSGSVYISNIKVDDDYTAWPFINNQGNMVDHFYTPIYNGSLTAYKVSSTTYYRLRSIPRRIVMNSPGNNTSYTIPWDDGSTGTVSGIANTNATAEWAVAMNNNPNINLASNASITLSSYRASMGWFTEVFCDIQLINNLLVLIGKNLDTQYVFGNGNMNGNGKTGYSNNGVLYTGAHEYNTSGVPQYDVLNQAGLFWGSTSVQQAVKVFGMENWWGNQYRRYAGHINKSSSNTSTYNHFIKNTFGTEDGSSGTGYTTDGTGYIDTLCETPDTGYIKNCKFINDVAIGNNTYKIGTFLASVTGGGSSQFFCDYFYKATSTTYALCGGRSNTGLVCGAFCINESFSAIDSRWYFGAALSFKPVS
jgi:hypothetical protein